MTLSKNYINNLNENLYKKHIIKNNDNINYILEYNISKIPEEIKILFNNLDINITFILNQEIIEKNNIIYLNYKVKYYNNNNINNLYNTNNDFKKFADNFVLYYYFIIYNNNIEFNYNYDKSYIDNEENIINKLLLSFFYNYMDNILINKIKNKYVKIFKLK